VLFLKLIKCILTIAIFAVFFAGSVFASDVNVSAESAILIDGKTGTVIFEKNARQRRSMASTTKIMTAVVAINASSMDDVVTVKPEYTKVEGSSMYLNPGEKLSMEELLNGLLLMSGNDAAKTIAGYISGDDASFAGLMNKEAQKIGLNDTHFDNPSGLDGETHYTTAFDMAKLSRYAMNDVKGFAEIVSRERYKGENRLIINHNKFLAIYGGACGIKTGFTKKSGRCLVTGAERNGSFLIAVTLNAPDDWNDHKKMMDAGFSEYKDIEFFKKGEEILRIPVVSGKDKEVSVTAAEDAALKMLPQDIDEAETNITGRKFVYAGIKSGDIYGYVHITVNGNDVMEIPLIYAEDIELREDTGFFDNIFKNMIEFANTIKFW